MSDPYVSWAFEQREMRPAQRLVLCTIAYESHGNRIHCTAAWLQEATGLSEKRATGALEGLVLRGLVISHGDDWYSVEPL